MFIVVFVGFASLLGKNCANKQTTYTVGSSSCFFALGCHFNGSSCIKCKEVTDEDECGTGSESFSTCRWEGSCKAHTCSSMGKAMADEVTNCGSGGTTYDTLWRTWCAAYGCTYSSSKCACGIAIYIIVIIVVVVIVVVIVVIVVIIIVVVMMQKKKRKAAATQPTDGSQPGQPGQPGAYPQQGQYPPGTYPPQGQYPPGTYPPQGQYPPGAYAGQYPPGTYPPQGQYYPGAPPQGQAPPGTFPPQQFPPQPEGFPPQQAPPLQKEDPPQEVAPQ